mmetsp:Transcript_42228/g.92022  ORF Transcript_42228/g.92022 Transcript_42228/m.92022 type:complete len:365 (-) Transcript_42228:63-1157(-)
MVRLTSTILALVGTAALVSHTVGAAVVFGGLDTSSRSHHFLAAGMQPGVAARSLIKVEEEWQAQAALFAECNAAAKAGAPEDPLINCAAAPKAFAKSCATTVKAIYQGSSGDRSVATEYMGDVCEQQALVGWHRDRCHGLADAIVNAMSEDTYYNREVLDGTQLCHGLWEHLAEEQRRRVAAEVAADEQAAAQHAKQQVAASPAAVHSLAGSSASLPDLPDAAAGRAAEAHAGAGRRAAAGEKAADRAMEVAASPAAVHSLAGSSASLPDLPDAAAGRAAEAHAGAGRRAAAGEKAADRAMEVAASPAAVHAVAVAGEDAQALPPMGAHPPPGVPRGPPAHAAAPAPAGPPGRRHRGGHGKRQE